MQRMEGQIWGWLSWAATEVNGVHTGKWLMASPGSVYAGDKWLFMGPATLPFPVRVGRIRLNAFGRQVYLSRLVDALVEAALHINDELTRGRVGPRDTPALNRLGADVVNEGFIEVAISNAPAHADKHNAGSPKQAPDEGGESDP